jgi:hypothetical protein
MLEEAVQWFFLFSFSLPNALFRLEGKMTEKY